MNRSQIEKLFNSRQYSELLTELDPDGSSHLNDTIKLRCLRALGDREPAVENAARLLSDLNSNSTPYKLSDLERGEQLRFIALVFSEFGKAKDACDIMQQLCKKESSTPALHREYAYALSNDDQFDKAEEQLIAAIAGEPNNANSHTQLARIYCRTGRVQLGYNSYTRAATLEPENPTYLQRLVYWSNYLERTTQRSNYQLSQLWASKAFPKNQAGSNTWRTANPDKELKVGFVSSDFSAHPVSFFITPLLRGLAKDKSIKVAGYSNTKNPDHITDKIQNLCDIWRDSSHKTDKELAAQIGADQIDILIDLNGHTSGNRLAVFSKLVSPLQMSWLGYPSTTGLKSIGYRITDDIADPEDSSEQNTSNSPDRFFSEKLIRMPNGFLCYEPHEKAPKIAASDNHGVIRFGSFNNLAKVSSRTIDAWAQTLHAVPNSTLYIKRQQLIHKNARDHIIHEFQKRGIEENRLILKTSKAKIEQHLNEYNHIDIALDTLPYNGTTTTLEALWMGVPVITLAGNSHVSRVSASILSRLNLSGLACKSIHDFAAKAKELSENPKTLTELRKALRQTMKKSALMNEKQFAEEFSSLLRKQWQEWCTERNIEDGLQSPNTLLGAAK